MLHLSGTKLHFSTAYHPQSDGQTEVRNRGLEQYLRAFAADRPSKWCNLLPWAELALNCFHHAALGTSPFKALYGREPPLLVASPPSAATPPKVADLIRQRGALLRELRDNLERAQQRMKDSANKHRRHVEFEEGDMVWLKLQPYRQHSVAKPLSAKLARRYYGPFEVVQRVGPVAYRLRLPDGSRIHDVFHVSLLREFVAGEDSVPHVPLPVDFVGGRPVVYPIAFTDSQVMWHDGKAVEHVLVRWSDGTDSPSWEPVEVIRRRFPDLNLEVKEAVNQGGVDKSVPDDINDKRPKEVEVERTASLDATPPSKKKKKNNKAAARTLRPREQIKPPQKYANYVSK